MGPNARAAKFKQKWEFGKKYSGVLYISLCLQINGLQSQNCSMRHQPQRLEKERVVSHFWGLWASRRRTKDSRAPRAPECLMSVFTVPLSCLNLSGNRTRVTKYQHTICITLLFCSESEDGLQRAHGDSGDSSDSFCDNTFLWGLHLNRLLLKPTVGL